MARTKGAVSLNFKKTFFIGAKFGKWEIISDELIYDKLKDRFKLKVKCLCGENGIVDPYSLKKGTSTCCFNCGHNKIGENHPVFNGYKEIPGSWFNRYSKTTKHKFNITIKYIYDLWIKQNKKCALSGLDIDFHNSNFRIESKRKNKNFNYDLICTASLDRINSKKGYEKNNVQLVHKDVNMIKKEYEQNYFINLCKLIVENHNK